MPTLPKNWVLGFCGGPARSTRSRSDSPPHHQTTRCAPASPARTAPPCLTPGFPDESLVCKIPAISMQNACKVPAKSLQSPAISSAISLQYLCNIDIAQAIHTDFKGEFVGHALEKCSCRRNCRVFAEIFQGLCRDFAGILHAFCIGTFRIFLIGNSGVRSTPAGRVCRRRRACSPGAEGGTRTPMTGPTSACSPSDKVEVG